MTALKVWWAKSRWAVWALIGLITVIMLAVLKSLFFGGKPKPGQVAEPGLPPVPKALQEKVNKAEEDALKARVFATVKASEEKAQLAEVLKIDDGAERRKRLAEMLKG